MIKGSVHQEDVTVINICALISENLNIKYKPGEI